MARTNIASQGKAGEPAKSGIHRAAERIGKELMETESEPARERLPPIPPGSIAELDALRRIAKLAGFIFEHNGESTSHPIALLREALRSAGDDFQVIMDAHGAGMGVPEMFYMRAKARAELAIELAGYRLEFDPRESEGGAS